MKLRTKEYFFIVIVMLDVLSSTPVYESPVIIRAGVSNYNPRIESINLSSAEKNERYLNNKLKNKLEGEMIGNFSLDSLNKLFDLYSTEGLEKKSNNQIVEEVGNLLKNSIELQKYITFTSQAVKKRLDLLDVKLKQIEVIDNQVDNLKATDKNPEEKTRIETDITKAKNERAFEILASASSLFNLNYNSACQVLKVAKEELDNFNSSQKDSSDKENDEVEAESEHSKQKTEAEAKSNITAKPENSHIPDRDQTKLQEGLKEMKSSQLNKFEDSKAFRFLSRSGKLKGMHIHKRRGESKLHNQY